jgi:quercetin dioxygenase-like cupin family protein
MTTSAPPTRALWHLGFHLRVLVDGAATAGRHAVAELRGGRGAALPAHVHADEDEWVLVLAGRVSVRMSNVEVTIGAGERLPLPRGRSHGLTVASGAARFLQVWTPAGHEDVLRRLSDPVLAGQVEPPGPAIDRDDVAAVLAGGGVTLLPYTPGGRA